MLRRVNDPLQQRHDGTPNLTAGESAGKSVYPGDFETGFWSEQMTLGQSQLGADSAAGEPRVLAGGVYPEGYRMGES